MAMKAAFIALGMEADVSVFDRSIDRLRELDIAFGGRADTCYASTLDIEQRLPEVDLVIGAVLVHGAKAPYVIRRDQLKLMKKGAVLVDVSIDQGGCFETSRPTTASRAPPRPTPGWPRASTSSTARSPTRRWPRRPGSRMSSSSRRWAM